jgi:hypothetical protein
MSDKLCDDCLVDVPDSDPVPPQPAAEDLGGSDISPSHARRVALSLQGSDEAIDVGAKGT